MTEIIKFDSSVLTSRYLPHPLEDLLEMARGKSILNVGACGNVTGYMANDRTIWMHHRLTENQKKYGGKLRSIDIDDKMIALARENGYEIENLNAETADFGEQFDIIHFMDVIEHMNAPGTAVENLSKYLAPGGKMIVTTANAYSLPAVVRSLFGLSHPIYYDHTHLYAAEHFLGMARRYGLKCQEISFYTLVTLGLPGFGLRKLFHDLIGRIQKKWCQNLWVVYTRD